MGGRFTPESVAGYGRNVHVVMMALHFAKKPGASDPAPADWRDLLRKVSGIDVRKCSACGAGEMRWRQGALPSLLVSARGGG